MKRFLVPVLVLILVMVCASLGWAATQIKDVDPTHWAYQSVKMLIDKGYLSLYEDSTFRGDKTITRYQLADVLARILQKIDDGSATVAPGDVNSIRQLTVEFRKELVEIVQAQNLFQNRVSQVEKNQIVMKEDIAKNQQQILDAVDQLVVLKDLDQQMKTAQSDIAKTQEQIAQVEKKMAEGLAFTIADLNKQIEDVKAQNQTDTTSINSLKETDTQQHEEIAKQKAEIAKQQELITQLQQQLAKLQEDSTKLQQNVVTIETNSVKQQEENKKMVEENTQTLKDSDRRQMFWLVTSFLLSIFAR